VVSVHDGQRWRLALVDVRTSALTYVPLPDTANHYDAVWGRGARELIDVSDLGGVPNIERIDLQTLDAERATHVLGAAVAPEVNVATGAIWFLSLYSRGYDLRSVSTGSGSRTIAELPATLTPAAPIPVESRPALGVNPVTAPRPFSLTPRSFRWIPQPEADADGVSAAIGLESMDVIGRSELLATGAFGDAATWRGGALSFAWHGAQPSFRATLFSAEQRLSASRSPVPMPFDLDQHLTGALVAVDGTRQFDRWAARYQAGASTMSTSSAARNLVFGDGAAVWVQRGDRTASTANLGGNITIGRAFDASFYRGLAGISLSTNGAGPAPIAASATYGRTGVDAPPFEQFALGGGPSPVLDRMLLTQRVAMPALPAGIAAGSSVFTYRVSVATAPLSWYWWSGSTARAGDSFEAWHRVIGAEWSQSVAAIPFAGTPAARAQIGVGESLDAPFRRKVRLYLNLVLNP
jgi:hypothetical protein